MLTKASDWLLACFGAVLATIDDGLLEPLSFGDTRDVEG